MKRLTPLWQWRVLTVGILFMLGGGALAQKTPNQISFWRTQFQELTPAADARVARAQHILTQLVRATGTWRGPTPRLFVLQEGPWELTLPIALPDGWIVLSKDVLSLCYQEPVFGDDRLAFVLGHELAHLMQDHFWHIKYFQSWKQSQGATMPSAQPAGLSLDQLQHQEFQADMHGILYATMAGFNPQAVVPNDRKVNFFQAWLQAWRPLGHRVTSSGTHPNAEQRDEVLRISLQRVAHQAAAFQAGLWWLYAGDYRRAVQAFKQFLDLFPAREVYHNLALSHHLLALQAYQLWQPNTPVIPFQLTLAIEPVTRANRLYAQTQRGGMGQKTPEQLFRRHLDEAIVLYRQAMTHAATYTPSVINVAQALMVRGIQSQTPGLNADVVEAQAVLMRAKQSESHESWMPQLLNTLGAVSFYAERIPEAKEFFTRASALAPTDTAPRYNLSYLAQVTGQPVEAKKYQQDYQQFSQSDVASPSHRNVPTEHVMGAAVGHFNQEVPKAWGERTTRTFELGETRWRMNTYPNGIMTLSQDDEILLLHMGRKFSCTSVQGIGIGSQSQAILKRYGVPTRRLTLPARPHLEL